MGCVGMEDSDRKREVSFIFTDDYEQNTTDGKNNIFNQYHTLIIDKVYIRLDV